MAKLVIIAPDFPEYVKRTAEIAKEYEVVFVNEHAPKEEIIKEIEDAEIVFGQPLMDVLEHAKRLKWLQMQWAGVDRYRGGFPDKVVLTNVSGAYGEVIGEHVIALSMALCRRLPAYFDLQRQRGWKDLGAEKYLSGGTALILGCGDLGSASAKRFKGLGLKTIGLCSRKRAIEYFDEVYELKDIAEQIGKADVVVGCLPDTSSTRGILDYAMLKRMKSDALLVNVGRGSLIVEKDLIAVLNEGHLFGVGLDVFEREPLSKESGLYDFERVIITPHVAGIGFHHAKVAEEAVWRIFFENLERYLRGEALVNVVDLKAGYARKEL